MQAVVFDGGAVTVQERPAPTPGRHDVLVDVHGAGVNGADLLQLAGRYPPPAGTPPDMPGLEFAGRVAAVGHDVTRWQVNDAVMGIVSGAAQAAQVAVHEDLAMPVPASLSDLVVAGGLPEALVTAHDALVTQAGVSAGDRVLITGAAGGVGTIAVQLAAGLGASVVACVRGTQRRDVLVDLGASEVVQPDEVAEGPPYDVVLELVGAPILDTLTGCLAMEARIVVIGVGAGATVELNLLRLMRARATLRGSTLRARPLADRIIASRRAHRLAAHLLDTSALQVPVHARHELQDAAAAYDSFRSSGTVGKTVIAPVTA